MKVAAAPQIFIGRCPKVVFKSPVASPQSLATSHTLLFCRLYDIRIEQTFGEIAVAHGDLRESKVLHKAV